MSKEWGHGVSGYGLVRALDTGPRLCRQRSEHGLALQRHEPLRLFRSFPLSPFLHSNTGKVSPELRPGFECNIPAFQCSKSAVKFLQQVENKRDEFRDLGAA